MAVTENLMANSVVMAPSKNLVLTLMGIEGCDFLSVHTSKPTQMAQNVSRKWQLLHFTLNTLQTPQLFGYEMADCFSAVLSL